jgi:hypothetical protein
MELSLNLTTFVQIANFGIAFLLLKKMYFEPVATSLLQEMEELAQFDALLINQEAILANEKKEADRHLAQRKEDLQKKIPLLDKIGQVLPEEHQEIPKIEIEQEEMVDLFTTTIMRHLEK